MSNDYYGKHLSESSVEVLGGGSQLIDQMLLDSANDIGLSGSLGSLGIVVLFLMSTPLFLSLKCEFSSFLFDLGGINQFSTVWISKSLWASWMFSWYCEIADESWLFLSASLLCSLVKWAKNSLNLAACLSSVSWRLLAASTNCYLNWANN